MSVNQLNNLYELLKIKSYIIYCYNNNIKAVINNECYNVKYTILVNNNEYVDVSYTYNEFNIIYRINIYMRKNISTTINKPNYFPHQLYILLEDKRYDNIPDPYKYTVHQLSIDILTYILKSLILTIELLDKEEAKSIKSKLNIYKPTIKNNCIEYKLFHHPELNPNIYGFVYNKSNILTGISKDYRFLKM